MQLQDVIDDLRGATFKSVPEQERADTAKRFIERCGYAAAGLTLLPVPFSDVLAVVPLHVAMIMGISEIHERPVTRDSATELALKIATASGLSLIGRRIGTAVTKALLPGLGGLLAAPSMYAQTIALGAVARCWFERGEELSDVEIKTIVARVVNDAKDAYDPARAAAEAEAKRRSDPAARLEKLKELKEKGLIDQAEHDEQKKRILAEL
ncbi:MAG TPA: DUF697 domain-containing protein [Planctomycetota bacterium]|nr:DUF697 domain-containing protein [Planctomycetota bacterium]